MAETGLGIESRRPTLYGSRHAISAGHYLAAAAGFAVLEAGGNAVDAGCCAGMALAVLHSDEVNFAGVAPIMIRPAGGPVVTIAGLGHWPRGIDAELFLREHAGAMPVGVARSVVPAAPDAWITALRDHGTMSFGEVAGAAVRLACEGFSMFDYMAGEIAANAEACAAWPSSAAVYLPRGRPPRVGERFVQRDLGATIQHMADEERAAAGRGRLAALEAARRAFYCGDIAQAIVSFYEDEGGYLTREDMATFASRYEPAISVRWRDFEVFTCGPWCQGPVLAQSLLMLERAGLAADRIDDPDYAHLLLEVLKGSFADREYRYGDPAFVDVGMDELLSSDHLAQRLALIGRARAYPGLPPAVGRPATPLPIAGAVPGPARPDTSYVCVIDRWGNAFSATPSDGAFTAPVVPGLGIVVSTRGDQSRPDPAHPCGVAPGKRPRLTPNPALAVRDDGSVLAFGCPGGDMQVQAMLQVFLNAFHFGLDIQDAINAPRVSTWSFPNSFAPHEYLPNRVRIEGRYDESLVADLQRRGHDVERWPDFTRGAAAVEAIFLDRSTGFYRAGADPRQPAYAVAN